MFSLEVGADDVDEVFGEFGGGFALLAHEVEADVVLHNFSHETVDAAANSGKQHEYVGALVLFGEGALDGFDLAFDAADALKEFRIFVVCHDFSPEILQTKYTLWGYTIPRQDKLTPLDTKTTERRYKLMLNLIHVLTKRARGRQRTADKTLFRRWVYTGDERCPYACVWFALGDSSLENTDTQQPDEPPSMWPVPVCSASNGTGHSSLRHKAHRQSIRHAA
jgi:hypothetical protein